MTGIRNESGFTLIEIVVALILIAIAATMVGPAVMDQWSKGQQSAARAQIGLFMSALKTYRLDVGHYPTTSQGLEALRKNPGEDNWNGPYLDDKVPLDPWKRKYEYMNPGDQNPDGVDIWSWGADGKEGGEKYDADVGNW
ncbi:MAG: type II secretion system major pseudopilin GspG [Bacillota bacterium]